MESDHLQLKRLSLLCVDRNSLLVQVDEGPFAAHRAPPAMSYSTYYDIPEPQDKKGVEWKVWQYLESQEVHMSHPSLRQAMKKPRLKTSSSDVHIHTKATLIERRSRLFSISFGRDLPRIAIPGRATELVRASAVS